MGTTELFDPKYSVLPSLLKRYDREKRQLALGAKNRAELRRWRRVVTAKLKHLIGYHRYERAPLNARITQQIVSKDHVRQRVEIQTEPGVRMPFFVLIPRHAKPPFAAVIAAHGHSSGGKIAVVGDRSHKQIAAAIKKFNYDYGLQFARAGFIVFCPDARGFGERQEQHVRDNILNQSCEHINHMAHPLGQTVTGMWAWDIHRLVDYIKTREDCTPGKIGCAGLSGGGLQTLWSSALDTRIRCAIISGYFYGYKQSLLTMYSNCSCNYVPQLYHHVDMGDIGALIAPRPLMIETGSDDALNGASGIRNVKSQVRITRIAYRLLGAGAALKHVVFDGEHRWHGVDAADWMRRGLAVEQHAGQ